MGTVSMDNREKMTVTGVRSVERFTESEIRVYTDCGDLMIRGSGLVSDSFDPASGVFRMCGSIDALFYTTEKYHLSDNIISRIFR